jgi:hypothetical protein
MVMDRPCKCRSIDRTTGCCHLLHNPTISGATTYDCNRLVAQLRHQSSTIFKEFLIARFWVLHDLTRSVYVHVAMAAPVLPLRLDIRFDYECSNRVLLLECCISDDKNINKENVDYSGCMFTVSTDVYARFCFNRTTTLTGRVSRRS